MLDKKNKWNYLILKKEWAQACLQNVFRNHIFDIYV